MSAEVLEAGLFEDAAAELAEAFAEDAEALVEDTLAEAEDADALAEAELDTPEELPGESVQPERPNARPNANVSANSSAAICFVIFLMWRLYASECAIMHVVL